MANHVIIGGGPAAQAAIESIRQAGSSDPITVISNEPMYARMALPYFIAGEKPEGLMFTANEAYFAQKGVTFVQSAATGVDTTAKTVSVAGGETVNYDTLLIATGSSAVKLNVPGADLPGVINLWTLDDARACAAAIKEGTRVVFVGAGFIGLIVVNALFKRKCQLSVVEIAGQILPRMLDAQSATLVEGWLKKKGVALHTGNSVTGISANADGTKSVQLKDGSALTTDLVIMSAGIKANLGFLDGSGVAVGQGVLVNERLESNVPGVFAAGDCAQGPDVLSGAQQVHAIQPTASEHGKVAGANMAGSGVVYRGSLLINILDVCGLQCASFGQWSDSSDVTCVSNDSRPAVRKFVWSGNRIVGAIFVGRPDDLAMLTDVGMVKGLIQTKADLGVWKKYLSENPFDVRRAYVGSGAAAGLLGTKLTANASKDRDYRFNDLKPAKQVGEAHAILVGTKPVGEPEKVEGPAAG